MKKIIYGLSLVFSLGLTACEDFLTEEPKSTIAPNSFYNTDSEVNAGAIGCYTNVAKIFGGGASGLNQDLNYHMHFGTDISRPTGGRESAFSFHTYTLSSATEGTIPALWRVLYRGIADANNLVDKVSVSTGTSEMMRNQIVAEGVVYRAFYYYYLTTLFGDVPFMEHFDTEYAISGLPRTNASEIHKEMIEDLEEVADNLPNESAADYKGRPTRWAAKMLLSKFYLWEKDWQKVSDLCEDIITNSPHQLMAEYKDMWGVSNEYNKEFIWEFDFVQHMFTQLKTVQMCPRGNDEKTSDTELKKSFVGYGLLTTTDEMLQSFDKADKRRIWYRWLDGDSRVNFKYNYVAKFLDKPEEMIRNGSGINIPFYRLADTYLMQAEAENELNNGPSIKAYERINRIRLRAGIESLSNRTKEQFFNDIMNERKWELAFEYQRKTDLCRWDKLVEVVQGMTITNTEGVQLVKAHHQLLPIPTKELAKNSNLTQNPGY